MKVLIVGSGGREHAIAWAVSKSAKADKIYCAPGNAGIEEYAECVNIGAMEFDKLVAFAKEKEIDLTIIGMDDLSLIHICMRKAYEEYEQEAAGFAGPACFEVFGEEPFEPVNKPESYRLSERQQSLSVEYSSLSNELLNEFINQEERSFTIIAYPVPSIGEKFPEIFEEIRKVNTLDNELYKGIQQNIINILDQAESVHIMGRGRNMTNLTVALCDLKDAQKETKFENCLADVNIPVGEVFTSPKLKGTNGLLHVTEVYLNGLCYKDLKITFKDGMVDDYECANFPDKEDGRKFIKENLLYNRETLPMGECAIGTNTTAYVMAAKYGLSLIHI